MLFFVAFVLFSGLLPRFSGNAAIGDVAWQLAGQLKIIVDDIFEMNAGCARVGKERHERGFAFVLLVFGDTPVVHGVAESQALQHLCLRQAQASPYLQ